MKFVVLFVLVTVAVLEIMAVSNPQSGTYIYENTYPDGAFGDKPNEFTEPL